MLGLLVLYFIGKAYYSLAEKYGRNKWGLAILGCVIYYGSLILLMYVLKFLALVMDWQAVLEMSDILLSVFGVAVGLLVQWGVRLILQKTWERNSKDKLSHDILDDLD